MRIIPFDRYGAPSALQHPNIAPVSAISKVRLQEAARRAFQTPEHLPTNDLAVPPGSHQDEKAVPTLQAADASEASKASEVNRVDGANEIDHETAVSGAARSGVVRGDNLHPDTGTKRNSNDNDDSMSGTKAAREAGAASPTKTLSPTISPATAAAPTVTATTTSTSARSHGGVGSGSIERTKSVATMMGGKKKTSARLNAGALSGHGGYGSANQMNSSHHHSGNGSLTRTTAEHQQDDLVVGGIPEVEAINLPDHVLTEDNCTFWVSKHVWLSRGVRT